jgi:hypothetical protein
VICHHAFAKQTRESITTGCRQSKYCGRKSVLPKQAKSVFTTKTTHSPERNILTCPAITTADGQFRRGVRVYLSFA